MMVVYQILIKNFKLLLRSRSSAAIIVVAPLALILLSWLFIGGDAEYALTLSITDDGTNPDVQQFAQDLEEYIDVRLEPDLNSCLQSVRIGEVDACAHPTKEFSIQNNATLTFFIDETKIHMNDYISARLASILREKNSRLSAQQALTYAQTVSGASMIVIDDLRPTLVSVQDRLVQLNTSVFVLKDELASVDPVTSEFDDQDLIALSADLQSEYNGLVLLFNESLDEFTFIFESINDVSAASPDILELTERGQEKIVDYNDDVSLYDSAKGDELTIALTSLINKNKGAANELALVEQSAQKSLASLSSLSSDLILTEQLVANMSMQIENILTVLDQQNALPSGSPLNYDVQYISNAGSALFLFLPALLVVITMVSCLTLATVFVSEEKQSPSLFRVYMSPLGDLSQVVGILLTCIVVSLIQYLVFLVVAIVLFPEMLFIGLHLGLPLVLNVIIFSLLGTLIGYLFSTQYNAMLASVITLSFFILFSDVFVPINWLPEEWIAVILYSPFTLTVDIIRQVLLYDVSLPLEKCLFLGAYGLILLIFVLSAVKSHRLLVTFYHNRFGKNI